MDARDERNGMQSFGRRKVPGGPAGAPLEGAGPSTPFARPSVTDWLSLKGYPQIVMSETPEDRSRIMRAVKGRDTKPEMLVRRAVHAMGVIPQNLDSTILA